MRQFHESVHRRMTNERFANMSDRLRFLYSRWRMKSGIKIYNCVQCDRNWLKNCHSYSLSISIDSGRWIHLTKQPRDGPMKLVNEIDKSNGMIASDLLNNHRSVLAQWIDFSIVSRYRIPIIKTMTMYRTVSIVIRSFSDVMGRLF